MVVVVPLDCAETVARDWSPTNQASFGPTACTPLSTTPATAGVATMLHAVPFQCSASAWLPTAPTAHTSLADAADTALRLALNDGLVAGTGSDCQAPPVNRSTNAVSRKPSGA